MMTEIRTNMSAAEGNERLSALKLGLRDAHAARLCLDIIYILLLICETAINRKSYIYMFGACTRAARAVYCFGEKENRFEDRLCTTQISPPITGRVCALPCSVAVTLCYLYT